MFLKSFIEFLRNLFSREVEVYEEEKKEEPIKVYPENYKVFPHLIFEPEKKDIDDEPLTVYKARFNSLYELYEYLKANPQINETVFEELSSIEGSSDFAGKPYEEAVEDLISDMDPGYEEFLRLQKSINSAKLQRVHKYKVVKTVAGGHLNIPAYSAGQPLCYETEEQVSQAKFVQIHVALSYYWGTSHEQVLNRAIIITNILKALENAGYSVDINAFELAKEDDELIHIIVQIKKHGQKISMMGLYKSLCPPEFLRRILFRVLETLSVRNDWAHGYGVTCSEEFTREALNLGKNDIFFDQPREMGIYGEDLAEDFENAIRHLNLEDKIDVEKAKRVFREETNALIRRRKM